MHLPVRVALMVLLAGTAGAAQRGAGPPNARTVAPPNSAAAVQLVGRVTSATDGLPLRRALITVTVDGRLHTTTLTDAEGHYQIEAPVGVSYLVSVKKSSYLTTSLQRPAARAGQGTLDVSLAQGAVIAGRVADPGGHPVVSIRVQLTRVDGSSRAFSAITVTDDIGAFRIAALAAGKYTLTTVANPEYPSGSDPTMRTVTGRDAAWQPSSGAVTVDLITGTEHEVALIYENPAVVLPYALVGGTISGRVTDESGEPATGLLVQLHRIDTANGRWTAEPYGAARITDDRGEYRLFHVKAGRYVLAVTEPSSSATAAETPWLTVYYPGTATPANATVLTVGRNQEIGGTDIVFTHTPGARVFGTALNAAGQPLRSVVSLIPANDAGTVAPPPRDMAVGTDGSFAFDGVAPGEYAVRANTAASTTVFTPITLSAMTAGSISISQTQPRDPEFAIQRILVSEADIGPLVIRTVRPATLRGRIVFEGGSPSPSQPERPREAASSTGAPQTGGSPPPVPAPILPRGTLEIVAVTTDPLFDNSARSGTVSSTRIDPVTGTFELPRLAGAVRLRLSGAPADMWLKSAYIGSTNLADTPFTFLSADDSRDDVTIVIASTAATVTGRTTGADAQPSPGAHVIVFSTNRDRWYTGSPSLRWVYSGEDARFTIASLPPGDYYLVAIDSDDNELETRSETERIDLLDSLIPRARRLTLSEGQTATVSPRLVTMGQ